VALDLTYPHIQKPKASSARLERLPRIRVAQIVMDYLAHGWSPEEMCRQHRDLRPAEVHAAMAYYFDHQDAIEREIEAEWVQLERERAQADSSAFAARLRARRLS
jgi:IS30 family transposase